MNPTRHIKVDERSGQEIRRVDRMVYELMASRKYPERDNIVVTYVCGNIAPRLWICPEYDSYAKEYAALWFKRRGLLMPETAMGGYTLLENAVVPSEVAVRRQNGFWRVVREFFVA